ncbi:MAG: DUF1428 domain-containing protein [Armatimonadetes bacterium]|nr:DUF1428 domain-containing protein [Akkermansiaceae bacterium]
MDTYTDGFVIPLPKNRIEEYRLCAERAGAVWREHGALEYYECIADDMEAKDMVSFPQLVNAGPDETVVFAWITFQSREHRDAVNAKVIADPRLADMMCGENQLFDCKRMAYGGFKLLVKA